jgi:hypothetical protein
VTHLHLSERLDGSFSARGIASASRRSDMIAIDLAGRVATGGGAAGRGITER